MRSGSAPRQPLHAATQLIVLMTAGMLVAVYAALRYHGLWGDHDTHVFATSIHAMLAEGCLVPGEYVYYNGYGFPVLATFLVHATGLSVAQLQIAGGALLAVWVVLPAWLAYRELTGSAQGATLATTILLVQPEFLFPILRGSHEKFTRGLMFICIYLLVRSILVRHQARRFAMHLLAFYLAIFASITFNNLMATSFIVALGLALILNLAVRQVTASENADSAATRWRLLYAIGISLLLAFVFTFYAYPPARHSLSIMEWAGDRLASLILDVEQAATNPYTTISTAWISLPAYLLVSIANWLLLSLSFVLWSVQTLARWRDRRWPRKVRTNLLWSLYGAFGFLGGLSIAVDYSGALGSNLQHRMFPSFAMIGAALVAEWVVRRPEIKSQVRRLIVHGTVAVLLGLLGVVAIMKATNEPMVSNNWQYYTGSEKTALLWSERYAYQQTLWVGLNERLRAAMGICCPDELQNIVLNGGAPRSDVRNFLISDIIRARARRVSFNLPVDGDSFLVYANGEADVYHRRPKSPFQK